jgi:hypothetical protein
MTTYTIKRLLVSVRNNRYQKSVISCIVQMVSARTADTKNGLSADTKNGFYTSASPSRVVPLPAIQHPRVPSNTSLAEIHGKYRELLPMTVVTPICMPPFHISSEIGMVQYNEVIAFLSLQISSRPSLVKPLSTRGLQPQTVKVGASYLHNSLGAALWLLSFLGYDVSLLQPQQQCLGQI